MRKAEAMTPLVVGHGPQKVIALHGWFGDRGGWGGLPDLIDHDNCSVAFMSYRGYGERKDEPGAYTMAEISADALAMADDLGWQRFALVGHSMGGMAIQRVFVDAPDRVQAMIGVAPVPANGSPFDEEGWALFSGAASNDENRKAIIDFTTGHRNTQIWIDQMVAYSVEHSTREAFGAYLEAWAKSDFLAEVEATYAEHKPLVHLIVGAHDGALGPGAMKETWRTTYPRASMTQLHEAGHYPMYETPVVFATDLMGSLEHLRQAW